MRNGKHVTTPAGAGIIIGTKDLCGIRYYEVRQTKTQIILQWPKHLISGESTK